MISGQSASTKCGKDFIKKLLLQIFHIPHAYNFCWTLLCWKKFHKIFRTLTEHSTVVEAPYKLSIKKLNSVCYIMSRFLMYLIFQLWGLYLAHFHSLVNYGIMFWGSTSSMNKVFASQKRYCLRCWELVQGVPAGSGLKNWRYYPYQASIFIL